MTSCYDVTKPDLSFTSSQLVDVSRKLILFLFPWFVVSVSSKMLLIIYMFKVMTSRRHVMTSQTLMYLSQHADVLEKWFSFVSMFFWVTEFKTVNDCLFICRHFMTSWHDVTKSASSISACGWARTMILFMFPWFNWLLIFRMLSFMYFCDDIKS